MIMLQIVEKPGSHLRAELLRAMREGDLRTFKAEKRGRKVVHTNPNYHGWMTWLDADGVIVCEIRSPQKPGEEWKLMGAFLGRLADKYRDQVHSVQIQFRDTTG
jgi:hypothetical protein